MLLKKEIRPENRGQLMRSWGGIHASWRRFHDLKTQLPDWLGISHNFASKWPRFSPQEDPRSGHDRAAIEVLISRRSFSDRLETIASRKLPDRGSIAPRSRFDWTAIVEFFHEASLSSDGLLLDERSRFINPVRRDQDSSPPPAVRS